MAAFLTAEELNGLSASPAGLRVPQHVDGVALTPGHDIYPHRQIVAAYRSALLMDVASNSESYQGCSLRKFLPGSADRDFFLAKLYEIIPLFHVARAAAEIMLDDVVRIVAAHFKTNFVYIRMLEAMLSFYRSRMVEDVFVRQIPFFAAKYEDKDGAVEYVRNRGSNTTFVFDRAIKYFILAGGTKYESDDGFAAHFQGGWVGRFYPNVQLWGPGYPQAFTAPSAMASGVFIMRIQNASTVPTQALAVEGALGGQTALQRVQEWLGFGDVAIIPGSFSNVENLRLTTNNTLWLAADGDYVVLQYFGSRSTPDRMLKMAKVSLPYIQHALFAVIRSKGIVELNSGGGPLGLVPLGLPVFDSEMRQRLELLYMRNKDNVQIKEALAIVSMAAHLMYSHQVPVGFEGMPTTNAETIDRLTADLLAGFVSEPMVTEFCTAVFFPEPIGA